MSYLRPSQAIQGFHRWYYQNLTSGSRSGATENPDQLSRFIPFEALKDFFDDSQRLRQILNEVFFPGSQTWIDHFAIGEDCLKVLAILLCIHKEKYIGVFVKHPSLHDTRLPLQQRPAEFPYVSTGEPDFFDAFYNKQWVFCTPRLRYQIDIVWEPERILPFVSKDKINGGGSATTYKIELHPGYNGLNEVRPQASNRSNIFVLKTFNRSAAYQHYENEVRAFATLRNNSAQKPGLIGFFGGFRQSGSFNILLEYANGGTLENYFEKVPPPTSTADRRLFWESLLPIAHGLKHIHLANVQDSEQVLCGYHQDINLRNILCSSFDAHSPYKCNFKLADLGLSHFTTNVWNKVVDKDAKGTKTFGAPECYVGDGKEPRRQRDVRQEVDIWSLGCIFSLAAVWLYQGCSGLDSYEQNRITEQEQLLDFRDTGSFHNGSTVLAAVTEAHEYLREEITRGDKVTGDILYLVTNMLSWQPEERFSAALVGTECAKILVQARPDHLETGHLSSLRSGAEYFTDPHKSDLQLHDVPLRSGTNPSPNSESTRAYGDQRNSTRSLAGSDYNQNDDVERSGQDENSTLDAVRTSTRSRTRENLPPRVHTIPRPGSAILPKENMSSGAVMDSSGGFSKPAPASSSRSSLFDESERSASKSQADYGSQLESVDSGIDENYGSPLLDHSHVPFKPLTDHVVTRSNAPVNEAGHPPWVGSSGNTNQLDPSTGKQSVLDNAMSKDPVTTASSKMDNRKSLPRNLGNNEALMHTIDDAVPSQSIPVAARDSEPPPVFLVKDAIIWWRTQPLAFAGINLPLDQKKYKSLLDEVKKRDQIILLDDSIRMLPHWEEAMQLLGLHMFMVQDADPDGVEVFLTGRSDRKRFKRPSAPVEARKWAEKHKPNEFSSFVTNIYTRFNEIVKGHQKRIEDYAKPSKFTKFKEMFKPLRPLNITVYTDGRWQEESDAATPIRNILETLIHNRRNLTEVGVQFVQFGKDPQGSERLRFLDQELRREVNGTKWDIVDTEPSNGNLWKILLGSIKKWFDDDHDEMSDIVSVQSIDATPSLTSGSTLSDDPSLFTSAAEELADMLFADAVLQPLFKSAFERVDTERLERNLVRLIKKYALNLKAETRIAGQGLYVVAALIKSQAGYVVYLLVRKIEGTKQQATIVLENINAQDDISVFERRLYLERYLEHAQPEKDSELGWSSEAITQAPWPGEANLIHGSDGEEESVGGESVGGESVGGESVGGESVGEESVGEAAEPERPSLEQLERLKSFMLNSRALQGLREDLRHFVFPLTGEVPKPTGDFERSRSNYQQNVDVAPQPTRLQYLNGLMSRLQSLISELFSVTEQEITLGHHRVQWICNCGQTFNQDFDTSDLHKAIRLRRLLADSGYEALIRSRPSRNANTPARPSPDMQMNPGHQASNIKISQPGNAVIQSGPSHSSTPEIACSPPGRESTEMNTDARWLLLCFDYYEHAGKAVHVPLEKQTDDITIFAGFRKEYLDAQSLIARACSWKKIKRISFVKFRLRLDPRTGSIPTICDDWDPPTGWNMAHEWSPHPSCGKPDIESDFMLHNWNHPHDAFAFCV
ncbi:MAG: hypothetical protein M1820_003050 [Bogoriella megaspora]|nr:MAG: hypothetical protein M1820_003050 [Bogoriella megaspora]